MEACVLYATDVPLKICLTAAKLRVSCHLSLIALCMCSTGTWLNLPDGATVQSHIEPNGLWYDIHTKLVLVSCFNVTLFD